MTKFLIRNLYLSGNEEERMRRIKSIIIEQINRNQLQDIG